MKQTAESIEAEAALVRSQLVAVGADIRHHADPAVIVDAAKASFKRRAEEAPSFLKENATPIGMVLLGGAFGAVLTGLVSHSRRSPSEPPAHEQRLVCRKRRAPLCAFAGQRGFTFQRWRGAWVCRGDVRSQLRH